MKHFIALITAGVLLCGFLPSASAARQISAESYICLNADTGEALLEKEPFRVLPMASTTKIMTAVVALESGLTDRIVSVSAEAAAAEGTKMGLREGDRLSLSDLVVGMLLSSGNDAALAVAQFLAGDEEAFAAEMNKKAAQLGLSHTSFVTASGLDAEGHASCAADLAELTAYALRDPRFCAAVSMKRCEITLLGGRKLWLQNHNKLLDSLSGCIGVKTGFTKKSGRCLVSAREKDGTRLIVVTLRAPDDWNDHAALYEMAEAQLHTRTVPVDADCCVPVAGGAVSEVHARAAGEYAVSYRRETAVRVELRLPRFVYAPVRAGAELGQAVVYFGTRKAAVFPLLAQQEVPASETPEQEGIFGRLCRVLDRIRQKLHTGNRSSYG